MQIEDLTDDEKRWYQALWDETGGDVSPAAVVLVHPSTAP